MNGNDVILSIMNFSFIGGSMGSVVGEAVSRAIVMAGEKKLPFILICSSSSSSVNKNITVTSIDAGPQDSIGSRCIGVYDGSGLDLYGDCRRCGNHSEYRPSTGLGISVAVTALCVDIGLCDAISRCNIVRSDRMAPHVFVSNQSIGHSSSA